MKDDIRVSELLQRIPGMEPTDSIAAATTYHDYIIVITKYGRVLKLEIAE